MTVAAQTRDFARRFFQVVDELGRDDWVPAGDAFERTVRMHADHPYVAYIRANRARRAGFAAAAERVRESEFPQIERRKAGIQRNARVFYRVGRPDASFSLDLPYEVPPSHPLRARAEAPAGNAMRRPRGQPSRSPWRRRQSARRRMPEASSGQARLLFWWHRLADAANDLLDMLSRAIARRASWADLLKARSSVCAPASALRRSSPGSHRPSDRRES